MIEVGCVQQHPRAQDTQNSNNKIGQHQLLPNQKLITVPGTVDDVGGSDTAELGEVHRLEHIGGIEVDLDDVQVEE